MQSAGRLKQRTIEALQPRSGEQFVTWDSEIRGFGVRVSPAGTKAFIVKYRLPTGRVRWATIDRVGVVVEPGENVTFQAVFAHARCSPPMTRRRTLCRGNPASWGRCPKG